MVKDVTKDAKTRMEKAIEDFKHKIATVRTGRASTSLLDNISVEYYGSMMPLNQVATIHAPEASMLTVAPFDPSLVNDIEKALRASELGVNPSNDGISVRLAFPPLTEERRKEFVKLVKGKAEDGRTAVRGARRDARKDLEALEKDGDISTDDLRRAEAELDKLTKSHEAEIDEALDAKTVELMEG